MFDGEIPSKLQVRPCSAASCLEIALFPQFQACVIAKIWRFTAARRPLRSIWLAFARKTRNRHVLRATESSMRLLLQYVRFETSSLQPPTVQTSRARGRSMCGSLLDLRSARFSFQFNSRNFGLLSDCVSAARCVSKCRGHDFGSHTAVELLPGT